MKKVSKVYEYNVKMKCTQFPNNVISNNEITNDDEIRNISLQSEMSNENKMQKDQEVE